MLKIGEIRELIRLLDETSLTELKIELEDMKLHLKKAEAQITNIPSTSILTANSAIETKPVSVPLPVEAKPASVPKQEPVETQNNEESTMHIIKSPMVGTFYRAPSPDAGNYVERGTIVNSKSIVCIVEAMKLMNEIEAEVAGEVVEIMAENGQLVEYGQPLFKIRIS